MASEWIMWRTACGAGALDGTFKHLGLKRLHERDDRSGMRPDLLEDVGDILGRLDQSTSPQGLNLPGYRLHALNAFDVELIDYH
jgi:hypothetical protein